LLGALDAAAISVFRAARTDRPGNRKVGNTPSSIKPRQRPRLIASHPAMLSMPIKTGQSLAGTGRREFFSVAPASVERSSPRDSRTSGQPDTPIGWCPVCPGWNVVGHCPLVRVLSGLSGFMPTKCDPHIFQ
jgi:hypothetical protein